MEDLVGRYGYLAVFLGAVFEAETVLAVGACAAQLGWLRLDLVMMAGFCGAFLSDQSLFWFAHARGPAWLARNPRLEMSCQRTLPLFHRWGDHFALVFRLLYGLGAIGPVLIASGPMPARRFARLDALGTGVGTVIAAAFGALFGAAIEAAAGDGPEGGLAALVGVAVAAFALVRLRDGWARRGA